jgi:energy-coupling factor transporter ATP-binding protein EcfA2
MADINVKESPFTPGRPVPVEYFVARRNEIERLERAIRQASSGRNENIFITGERGIGKSSLAWFMRYLAEKEYGFVGAHCLLGGARTLEEVMKAVFQRFLEGCVDKSIFDKLKGIFNEYIKGVTLFGVGVEFTDNKAELHTLVNNFLPALRKIYDSVAENGKKGLLLILDDLNGITVELPDFSLFLKSFVDGLATSGKPLPLLLILVGIEQRREDLMKHQPSVARIFDVVDLPVMNEHECKEFFTETFGKKLIAVADDALSLMVKMAGGYPMLMHEVGDAVFWQDKDNQIDIKDARTGISEAARNVGRKYIGTQVESVFRNKTYSSILVRMGRKLPIGTTFKRKDLLKESVSVEEQKNLDNFLGKVKQLGIMGDAEAHGEYRFVNPLYHLYMWYMDQAQSKTARNIQKAK